jgi:3-dehydroquinate synthase
MLLNFGHTIGHAIEASSNYKILHGFAVGLGILIETKIAQLLGLLSASDYQIIEKIFAQLGISANDLKKLNSAKIIQATKRDKKAQAGNVRYVLLKALGQAHINNKTWAHPVADEIVARAFYAVAEK